MGKLQIVNIDLAAQLRPSVGGAAQKNLAKLLALCAARVMSTMLFGLKATDAITYAGVLLAVTPIVVLAAAIPASRAARVDPVVACATSRRSAARRALTSRSGRR